MSSGEVSKHFTAKCVLTAADDVTCGVSVRVDEV